MPSHIAKLAERKMLKGVPSFLSAAVQYEVVMGSIAYGVSNDSSDFDVYGFAIAPKEDAFPHLRGEVPGFDLCQPAFKHFQQHHIFDQSALGGHGRCYDVTVYAIARYFQLLSENNPNIIDMLYVPDNCILYSTAIGDMVRVNRQLFLHKGCWPKFKGYAYSQLNKLKVKQPQGKRKSLVEKFGYDVKFAYHVVRLLNEVEQLLNEGKMDLTRNAEQLKAIRAGEWTFAELENHFKDKDKQLELAYCNSCLPQKPRLNEIRQLLLDCYEQYYGSIERAVVSQDRNAWAIAQIESVLNKLKD